MTNAAPTPTPTHSRATWVLLIAAVCLVALNLRMTITGVGPLLDEIAATEGGSPAVLGLLASIPLFSWAAFSPLAQSFAAKVGIDRAVSWALLALTLANVWRVLPGSPINIWAGTVLLGASLAVGNVLIPATIKRDFGPRVPLMMGVYSALLSGAAAIGAGIVAPISHFTPVGGEPLGWRIGLFATGLLAFPALILWVIASRVRTKSEGADRDAAAAGAARSAAPQSKLGLRVWTDRVAWTIAIYMGCQSATFYTWATWLVSVDMSRGTTAIAAGAHIMVYHVSGMIGSFVTPFIWRGKLRKIYPPLLPFIMGLCAIGFIGAPGIFVPLLAVSGFMTGSSLSVALTLVVQRSGNADVAAAASGMSQSLGYLIAGIAPVLFGWLFQVGGNWWLPLIVVLLATLTQTAAGLSLMRERMVFGRAHDVQA
ncbi:MFS transporter [Leucobacter sp. cx-42]|uniref:MFS transporter n=1 Tax=unclassified Leucobacter TaxID=2621730 RepID=UPI00165D3993|nr:MULTISPECIES: MFS transporter [unclassified Leucobacter]MBC9955054.1 MFS transporter [Leucobacter sp. cx-42]